MFCSYMCWKFYEIMERLEIILIVSLILNFMLKAQSSHLLSRMYSFSRRYLALLIQEKGNTGNWDLFSSGPGLLWRLLAYRSLLRVGNFQVFLLDFYHSTIFLTAFAKDLSKAYSALCSIDCCCYQMTWPQILSRSVFLKTMKLEDDKIAVHIQQYIFILHWTTVEADLSITCRPHILDSTLNSALMTF